MTTLGNAPDAVLDMDQLTIEECGEQDGVSDSPSASRIPAGGKRLQAVRDTDRAADRALSGTVRALTDGSVTASPVTRRVAVPAGAVTRPVPWYAAACGIRAELNT
ncbi:hypothetical protein GCM10029978_066150 [Actinoallomurus acanthiterrae]